MNIMMLYDRYCNDIFIFINDVMLMECKSWFKKIGKVVYKKM